MKKASVNKNRHGADRSNKMHGLTSPVIYYDENLFDLLNTIGADLRLCERKEDEYGK